MLQAYSWIYFKVCFTHYTLKVCLYVSLSILSYLHIFVHCKNIFGKNTFNRRQENLVS